MPQNVSCHKRTTRLCQDKTAYLRNDAWCRPNVSAFQISHASLEGIVLLIERWCECHKRNCVYCHAEKPLVWFWQWVESSCIFLNIHPVWFPKSGEMIDRYFSPPEGTRWRAADISTVTSNRGRMAGCRWLQNEVFWKIDAVNPWHFQKKIFKMLHAVQWWMCGHEGIRQHLTLAHNLKLNNDEQRFTHIVSQFKSCWNKQIGHDKHKIYFIFIRPTSSSSPS